MKLVIWVFCLVCFNLTATIINIPTDQPTIQAGIDESVDADTVLVQPGIYFENINYNGKNITVASLLLTTQDTTFISQTIIDGDQESSVVKFVNYEDSTAELKGFTIRNGLAAEHGGGIYCADSNPKLSYLRITNNFATVYDGYGGGLYFNNSNPILEYLTISNNISSDWGGGIFSYNSNLSLVNVDIMNNSTVASSGKGGGIFFHSSTANLWNVNVHGNSASRGGGIFCSGSVPILQNLTVFNNSADLGGGIFYQGIDMSLLLNTTIALNSAVENGGAVYIVSSNPIFINVTITDNAADCSGGGLFCVYSSDPILTNCILWNNSSQEIYFYENYDPNSISISYSDIEGGEDNIVTNDNGFVNWLDGNIDQNPEFLTTGEYPFSLSMNSPCIDAGIPDTTGLNLPVYDLAGNPRIFGDTIDMGAYEWQGTGISNEVEAIITKLSNFPNPFNPSTKIEFSIKNNSKIDLSIFNIKGQKIKTLINNEIEKGEYSIIWNGNNESGDSVSSGIYYYKLKVNNKTEVVKKCLLLK